MNRDCHVDVQCSMFLNNESMTGGTFCGAQIYSKASITVLVQFFLEVTQIKRTIRTKASTVLGKV